MDEDHPDSFIFSRGGWLRGKGGWGRFLRHLAADLFPSGTTCGGLKIGNPPPPPEWKALVPGSAGPYLLKAFLAGNEIVTTGVPCVSPRTH